MYFRAKNVFPFILLFPILLHAQNQSNDILLISHHIKEHNEHSVQAPLVHIKKTSAPLKAFLYLPLYIYQKVISEQISAGCEFDLSCSNYSITAIKEFGFAKGISLSTDRLTRCNGQSQVETQGYLINHFNGKTIDEPSMYHFKD